MKILNVKKYLSVLVCGAALSSPAMAGGGLTIPLINHDLGILGASSLTGLTGAGQHFLTTPGDISSLLNLPLAVVSMVSPGVGYVVDGNFAEIPTAITKGEFLLSPSIAILPGIPLLTAPLPGL
ncbi:MAG: hypothetical protein ACSHWQ_02375 [Spongiibacteraceae bacterium]